MNSSPIQVRVSYPSDIILQASIKCLLDLQRSGFVFKSAELLVVVKNPESRRWKEIVSDPVQLREAAEGMVSHQQDECWNC